MNSLHQSQQSFLDGEFFMGICIADFRNVSCGIVVWFIYIYLALMQLLFMHTRASAFIEVHKKDCWEYTH